MSNNKITTEEIPQICTRLEKAMEKAKSKRNQPTGSYEYELTDWRLRRKNLNMDLIPDTERVPGETVVHEEGLIDRATERNLVEMLFTSFLGGETEFIRCETSASGDLEIQIECEDTVARELALKCSILTQQYSKLSKFTQEMRAISKGRVNQALAHGIKTAVNEYMNFIVALECTHRKKPMSLQALWYNIQQNLKYMRILADMTSMIIKENSRGAQTLAIMTEFILDLQVPSIEYTLCQTLLSQAAVPYMKSVQMWIYDGEIFDPFDEFMIIESTTSKDEWKKVEDYWHKKYLIRKGCVPPRLKSLETVILNSGKYLNVIKECVTSEKDFKLAPMKELAYEECTPDKTTGYLYVINEAYTHASRHLLEYMLKEFKIKERIFSFKRYFLLQQGDFVVQLLDTCDGELSKKTLDILPSRLTTLVDMAIRIPSTNDDNYRDEIMMSLQKLTLSQQIDKIFADKPEENDLNNSERFEMTGYESFSLTMNCKWPISLVLHSKVLSSYQMLFRHLFYCKYIEKTLYRVWLLNLPLKGLLYAESVAYAPAHSLRYKMMMFLQNAQYYMMEVAIENHWLEFMEKFDSVSNIDDLIAEHGKFLNNSMKDCLLGEPELFRMFRDVLTCCLEYGSFIIRMRKIHMEADSEMIDSDSSLTEGVRSLTEYKRYPTFSQRMDQLTVEFHTKLTEFYEALQVACANDTTTKLVSLYFSLKSFFQKDEE